MQKRRPDTVTDGYCVAGLGTCAILKFEIISRKKHDHDQNVRANERANDVRRASIFSGFFLPAIFRAKVISSVRNQEESYACSVAIRHYEHWSR